MYQRGHQPDYDLDSTIKDPKDPARVIGFRGRNTRLGREAIVLKNETDETDFLIVPEDVQDELEDGAELAIIEMEHVRVASGPEVMAAMKKVQGDKRLGPEQLTVVDRAAKQFSIIERQQVQINH